MKRKKTSDLFPPIALVIEDDTSISQRISNYIKKFDFDVIESNHLDDAISSIKNQNVDLVMMDLNLKNISNSDKINGIDIGESIQRLTKKIPLIGYSSFKWDQPEKFENLSIFDEIISKDNEFNPKYEEFIKSLRDTVADEYKRNDDIVEETPESDDKKPSSPIIQLENIDPALYSALINTPELIKSLEWRVFEKLLADILKTFGYEIELKRGTKDGGIDIVAFSKSKDWGEEKYLLQAKRWKNKVGIEPVQQLMFLHGTERATKSCLATTSTFTRGAWQLRAQYQWQLELRDYHGIQDWISRASKIKFNDRIP
jgi:CheY-like chemotaxis protein